MARRLRDEVERHVLACAEVVRRQLPRDVRLEPVAGFQVLLVDCTDDQANQIRHRIELASSEVTHVAEDVELELIG